MREVECAAVEEFQLGILQMMGNACRDPAGQAVEMLSDRRTLALPKPGLTNPASSRLFLGDIGIPPQDYQQLGIEFEPIFIQEYWIELKMLPQTTASA